MVWREHTNTEGEGFGHAKVRVVRRQAARLQKCNLSVSFLLGCSIQTVPIQFAKKCRHDTPPSFSPARRGSTAFRFSAGSIRGHRRGLQEPFLRLLREMARASAPEWLPGPESRRKRHPGDQISGTDRGLNAYELARHPHCHLQSPAGCYLSAVSRGAKCSRLRCQNT